MAQQISGKVVDAATGVPLPYATVLYAFQKKILYTDSSGNFSLDKVALASNDSIFIQYLGYKKQAVPVTELNNNQVFKMSSQTEELKPVIVSSCKTLREYVLNKRTGSIKNYLGPGPETKIIILSRYLNNRSKEGYIKAVEFFNGIYNQKVNVPIRLRWYEWDDIEKMPGKELTNTNIFVFPYQKGWNTFTIPENSIYFPKNGVVFGFEFIYPVEFEKQFTSLATIAQKQQWLQDMNHRWSLGVQMVKDSTLTGFYIINNGAIQKYSGRGRNSYLRPAVKFTVANCIKSF